MGVPTLAPCHGATAPHAQAASPDPEHEARLAAVLGLWWREERPAWTEASWWEATLHEDARRLLWLAPGPDLVAALADRALGGPCPVPHRDDRMGPGWPTPGHSPGWPCACQVVTAAAWEACAAWMAARSAAALVAAAGPDPVAFDVGDGRQRIHDPAREELAHALRTSIPAMGNRIGAARALTEHPLLVGLVESAAISAWAGRLVLDHVGDLEGPDADRVLEEVATRVQHRLATGRRPYNSAEVNRLARAARLRVCPETARESRVRAFATRRVVVHPAGNGMATLVADLADVDAHRIHRRLTAIAAGLAADAAADGSSESRSRDQLRADILRDLLVGGPASDVTVAGGCVPGGAQGHRAPGSADVPDLPRVPDASGPSGAAAHGGMACAEPHVDIQVVVTFDTLVGLSDDPAEIRGVGPVPADVARELAADGRWRAWITDAAGIVTATGARGYVPSAGLARLIRARQPYCRFPGCRQPAARCDLDHAMPWPRGATTAANLGPLCRRHHNLKTHAGWDLDTSLHAGSATDHAVGHGHGHGHGHEPGPGWRWRTPAGFTITDGPEAPLGPATQQADDPSGEAAGTSSGDPARSTHPPPEGRGSPDG
jgi:hypothetical protein